MYQMVHDLVSKTLCEDNMKPEDRKNTAFATSIGSPNLSKDILFFSCSLKLSLILSVISDLIKPGETQLISKINMYTRDSIEYNI